MELTLIKTNHLPTFLKECKIIGNTDLNVSESDALTMVNGFNNKIRSLDKVEAERKIQALLTICAKLYCGMVSDESTPLLMQFAAEYVIKSHAGLGIDEIKLAFVYAIDGKTNANVKAYGGVFSIAMLGEILTAYREHRNKVINKVLDEQEKQKREQINFISDDIKEQMNARTLSEFMIDVNENIIDVQQERKPKWNTYDKVPAKLAELAINAGKIEVSDEFRNNVWSLTENLAKRQLNQEAQVFKNPHALTEVRNRFNGQYFQNSRQLIFAQLLIFQYIQMHKI